MLKARMAIIAGIMCCFAFSAHASQPGPLDGNWVARLPCTGSTGVYAEKCASGAADIFDLSMIVINKKICGSYAISRQLGAHVDENDMTDWSVISDEKGIYKIHFTTSGNTGIATLQRKGDALLWKTDHISRDAKQPGGTQFFEPPASATLALGKGAVNIDQKMCK